MARLRKLEGRTRAVGRGGDGVVETDEGIVFVPGVLPGERVELELKTSKRGARRGRLARLLTTSPHRVEPSCPELARCGGCPLMVADSKLQRDVKLAFLREACDGIAGAGSVEFGWVESDEVLGYRRRARLAWQGAAFGYRRAGTRRVEDIERCLVIGPDLHAAWTHTRGALRGAVVGGGEIRLERAGDAGVVVGLSTRDAQPPTVFQACESLSRCDRVAGVTLSTAADTAPATWGETTLALGEGDDTLLAPPSSFAQANAGVNRRLVEHVVQLAEPTGVRVLELHSGVGNFTVALAAASPSSLVAVEQDSKAVEYCRENLRSHGLEARVTVGDANSPPNGRFDVVVLDPPRHGARPFFEKSGVLPGPKRIVYVSCDTATLSRDLRIATAAGYRLDTAVGFDMFPQTAHLESLVRLVRTGA
jgi:23S rRNA (uracil1939-C5)-methyltransferase